MRQAVRSARRNAPARHSHRDRPRRRGVVGHGCCRTSDSGDSRCARRRWRLRRRPDRCAVSAVHPGRYAIGGVEDIDRAAHSRRDDIEPDPSADRSRASGLGRHRGGGIGCRRCHRAALEPASGSACRRSRRELLDRYQRSAAASNCARREWSTPRRLRRCGGDDQPARPPGGGSRVSRVQARTVRV